MATAPAEHAPNEFARARRAMIDSQLRPSGVNEDWVLEPMRRTAREDFVPADLRGIAYMDRQLPLGEGRAMSAPLAHARLLQEARPRPSDRALLVAGGTGYLAALLALQVYSLDVVEPDARLAPQHPATPNTRWHQGPLAEGWAAGAPYDLIVIDGAIEQVPDSISAQLAADGRLVTGSIARGVSRLAIGRKAGETIALQTLAELGFPVLEDFARPKGWSF